MAHRWAVALAALLAAVLVTSCSASPTSTTVTVTRTTYLPSSAVAAPAPNSSTSSAPSTRTPSTDAPPARSARTAATATRSAATTASAHETGAEIEAALRGPAPEATQAARAGCQRPAPEWNQVVAPRRNVVEGFTSIDSAVPGTPVNLYVSTTARHYRIQAYRMGYYGPRAQACLVWTSAWRPGRRQAPAKIVGTTNTPTAPWSVSLTMSTTGWTPGVYLLRIDGGSQALRSFMPLIVRSPSFAGRTVLVMPDTTWQAYNSWGGYSLYFGPGNSSKNRARAVPFDRPYNWGMGAGDFVQGQLPLVVLAEKLRIPLGYATDVDLQRNPGAFSAARTIVSAGHDEYYSPTMRQALTAARDHGVNLAFFGANDVYRKIRFANTRIGPNRMVINYKDDTDPIGVPSLVTTQWRDAPSNDPESSLTGADYLCATSVHYPLIVADAGNWLFAHTGVKNGTVLPAVVGQEFDGITLGRTIPRPLTVLFHSPVTCGGDPGEPQALSTKRLAAVVYHQDSTYYTTASGAGVLDVGSTYFTCALANSCPVKVAASTTVVITQMTTNFLLAAAGGPLGKTHPATDTVRTFYPKAPAR